MERKTKVHAEEGKQDLMITREFDLPLDLLFKAYIEPEFVEQWMGTKVLKLENKKHGGWQFETRDERGNVVFGANGVIHQFVENEKSHGPLKWRILLFRFNLNFWNSNNLLTTQAN